MELGLTTCRTHKETIQFRKYLMQLRDYFLELSSCLFVRGGLCTQGFQFKCCLLKTCRTDRRGDSFKGMGKTGRCVWVISVVCRRMTCSSSAFSPPVRLIRYFGGLILKCLVLMLAVNYEINSYHRQP